MAPRILLFPLQCNQAKSIETNNNVNIDKCQKIYCLQNSNDFSLFLHAVGFLQVDFSIIVNVLWTWMFAKVKVSLYVWLFVYFLFFSFLRLPPTPFCCLPFSFVCVCGAFPFNANKCGRGWGDTEHTHRKSMANIVIEEIKATLRNVRKSWKQQVRTNEHNLWAWIGNERKQPEIFTNERKKGDENEKYNKAAGTTTRRKSKHCTKMVQKEVKPFYSLDE